MLMMSASVMLAGCATGLQRTGYALSQVQQAAANARCRIAIRANAQFDTNAVEVLGKIRADEAGLSVDCDEAYVLDLFCKEACALEPTL